MAYKKDPNFSYNIEEFYGSLKEGASSNWCKAVLRMKWGDNPPSLDIRSIDMPNKRVGKGISLSNEEADKLVHILLDEGFGCIEEVEEAIRKRRDTFFNSSTNDDDDDDGMMYIDINI